MRWKNMKDIWGEKLSQKVPLIVFSTHVFCIELKFDIPSRRKFACDLLQKILATYGKIFTRFVSDFGPLF